MIKAGRLLKIDQGAYSDYQVIGFFLVIKSFVPLEELEIYIEQNPEQKENYAFNEMSFLNYLCSQGYLIEIAHSTLYLSSYGEYKEVEFYA